MSRTTSCAAFSKSSYPGQLVAQLFERVVVCQTTDNYHSCTGCSSIRKVILLVEQPINHENAHPPLLCNQEGRLLCGTFFLGCKQIFFCFQISFCHVKRRNRAGSSRNECDYSQRGTHTSFPLLDCRSCDNFGLAHFSTILLEKKS